MKKLVLVLLFISLTRFFQANAQETLTILHLNDTHSTLAPIDPRIANLRELKEELPVLPNISLTKMSETNVLTLHAGDFSIGDLFYNKYFGVPELQILKSLVDAITVGNHEWDLTPAAFLGTLQNAFRTFRWFSFSFCKHRFKRSDINRAEKLYISIHHKTSWKY